MHNWAISTSGSIAPLTVVPAVATTAKHFLPSDCIFFKIEDKKEILNLTSLQRGIFAKKFIRKSQNITRNDIYFAFPPEKKQYTANNWSKYLKYKAKKNIKKNDSINQFNSKLTDTFITLIASVIISPVTFSFASY